MRITKPRNWKLAVGQSLSVDGICSTVTKQDSKCFDVTYMPETLEKTTAGAFEVGSRVNLERSLRAGDFVDGHFVQGHVDARCEVVRVEAAPGSRRVTVHMSRPLAQYVVPRGSIAVNGVSLTVFAVRGETFTIAIIPHTLDHTNIGGLRAGDHVNIETDMLARHVIAARGQSARVKRNAEGGARKKAGR